MSEGRRKREASSWFRVRLRWRIRKLPSSAARRLDCVVEPPTGRFGGQGRASASTRKPSRDGTSIRVGSRVLRGARLLVPRSRGKTKTIHGPKRSTPMAIQPPRRAVSASHPRRRASPQDAAPHTTPMSVDTTSFRGKLRCFAATLCAFTGPTLSHSLGRSVSTGPHARPVPAGTSTTGLYRHVLDAEGWSRTRPPPDAPRSVSLALAVGRRH